MYHSIEKSPLLSLQEKFSVLQFSSWRKPFFLENYSSIQPILSTLCFKGLLHIPAWITAEKISELAALAARWRHELPSLVDILTLAPLWRRSLHIPSYPRLMAMCRAVTSCSFFASISRLFSFSRRWTVCLLPNSTAMWRGVQPLDVLTKFSFAPFFSKELRASREFDLKKMCLIFSCGKKKKLGKAKELLLIWWAGLKKNWLMMIDLWSCKPFRSKSYCFPVSDSTR